MTDATDAASDPEPPEPARLDRDELQRRLEAIEPGVVLAPDYVLRRVIRHEREVRGVALTIPHAKSYRVSRAALFELVPKDDLDLAPGRALPELVTLLVTPDSSDLSEMPPGELLVEYWRLLFHSQVHAALEGRIAAGALDPAEVKRRVALLGPAPFAEAGDVLDQEGFLLPPRSQTATYVELAAVFLELTFFSHTLIPWYFPSWEDPQPVFEVLTTDVDAEALFQATRPAGAADPAPPAEVTSQEPQADYQRLVREATELSDSGNLVRAAILRTRAARVAVADLEIETRAKGIAALHALVDRLARLVELPPEQADRWRETLPELLEKSDQGFWPQEARLLYDLQKACDDAERELYELNGPLRRWRTGEWIHQVPTQREILICRNLASAIGRLPKVRLYDQVRQTLSALLREATARCEARLRGRLRPKLLAALEEAGLAATTVPERVARDKICEELLDLITARGFLTYSDVRDVLSRNQLKLGNLGGPQELALGDPILRLDRRLREEPVLEGIYRAGEVYRRGLQRSTSLFAGTPQGRFLVWYLFLPFGGAFAILHVIELLVAFFAALVPFDPAKGETPLDPHLSGPFAVMALGAFLILLIDDPGTRRELKRWIKAVFKGVRLLVYDGPKWLIDRPLVQLVIDHPWAIAARHYLFYPLRVSLLIWLILYLTKTPGYGSPLGVFAIFVGCVVVLNTRRWYTAQEAMGTWMLSGWRLVRVDFVQGLFRLVMAFFKRVGEVVELFLYAVDEKLRFQKGDPLVATCFKGVMWPLWGPLSYMLRLTYDACIEPRINPIKYFSVVIVADKLFIPVTPQMLRFFSEQLSFLGSFMANTSSVLLTYAIPALVGFLIWEFKENWKLYLGNRSTVVDESPITGRGETLPQLMQPAVHSDTFPELYAKLRAAERKAHETLDWTKSRQHRAALDGVRSALRKFLERDFLDLIVHSHGWGGPPPRLGEIHTGLTNVSVELLAPEEEAQILVLDFEWREGRLLVRGEGWDWLVRLDPARRRAFTLALLGLYKLAGVDLVQEQLAAYLAGQPQLENDYELTPEGLWLWPPERYTDGALFRLDGHDPIRPAHPPNGEQHGRPADEGPPADLPAVPARQLSFRQLRITWDDWTKAWAAEQAGTTPELLDGLILTQSELERRALN